MRSNLCAAAVLAGVLFPAARAQDASPRPQPSGVIEEVFVRALAPPADDAAAFATVIDASEFPGRAIDLGSVLQRVPSARTQSYGGIGRFATVSLRGSSAEQVTVLVDGVPQNRALGGAVDLSSIPVSLVQRVTVFRGFGPPGTGLGGLVDIRTRRPGPAPQASADVLAGTLDTVLGTADGSLAIPGGRLRVSGETFRSAGDFGYLPGENSGVGTAGEPRRTRRRNNDVDSRAGALHAAWDDVLSGQLSAIVRVREREQGIPGTGDSPLGHVRLEDSGASAVAAWSRAVGGAALESLDVQLDALSERSLLSNPAGEAVIHADEQLTRTSGGGMLAVARWSLGAHRLSTSLGARTERSHIRDEGLSVAERGGLRRRLVTASARDSLPLGSARVTLLAEWELRRDDFAGAGNGRVPPPADDSRDAALGGSASLALPLGEGWTLRGSAGSFHRRPSLAELFGDSGQVRGNPSLDPEHGWKFEAGPSAAFRAGAWTWSAELAAFASRTDDMILVWPQSQGVSVAENVGSARVAGVEASASLRAPGGFAVDAAGTLQRARAAGGPYDGKRLPTVPERLGWIGTSWNPGRWSLGWELRYVGENSSDRLDEERYRLPARVLHDVRAARDVGAGIRLSVEVQNLFDRETRDVARFPLPGRLVYGGARWSYGGGR